MQNLKNKLTDFFNAKVTQKGNGLKFNIRELRAKDYDFLSTLNKENDISVKRSGTGLIVFISKSN